MSLTMCCLLFRIYDAWRTESCQKQFQRLLFDLTERWLLWMWNEKIENSKNFRSLIHSLRSRLFRQWEKTIRRISFLIIFFSRATHRFQHVYESRKIKNNKNSNSKFTVIQLAVSHQVQNRELYEIELSILKEARQTSHQIFFWVTHEVVSGRVADNVVRTQTSYLHVWIQNRLFDRICLRDITQIQHFTKLILEHVHNTLWLLFNSITHWDNCIAHWTFNRETSKVSILK